MNKTLIIILAIIIILLLLFFVSRAFAQGTAETSPDLGKKAPYRKISAEQAKAMIDGGQRVTIVDVRTPGEFGAAHIKDAINIANETIMGENPSGLTDLDATILVYCRSGARSAQASKKLLALGYTEVYDFGGIINWPYGTVQ
ncbi:MAG: rhodanese-like domain-containing protein [Sphaerochaeta sp.]|nr:rhodanese-like domain-containing protein [Sphaerochaeta sp.]